MQNEVPTAPLRYTTIYSRCRQMKSIAQVLEITPIHVLCYVRSYKVLYMLGWFALKLKSFVMMYIGTLLGNHIFRTLLILQVSLIL